MVEVEQIRERLKLSLDSNVLLASFEEWLARASWEIHRASSAAVKELVGAIQLEFAEYEAGEFSEDVLLSRLESLTREKRGSATAIEGAEKAQAAA